MSVSIRPISPQISFTERSQEQKDAEKKILAGGGAIAGVKTFTTATKTTAEVTKKASTLGAKASGNFRWVKDAILNWKTKFGKIGFLKPILESKAYARCAGALGYIFGVATLISGGSDIVKVATDAAQGKLLEK